MKQLDRYAPKTVDHAAFLDHVIAVEWHDTVVGNSWTEDAEVRGDPVDPVISIGVLIEATPGEIKLGAGVSEKPGSRQWNPTITIPRGMVVRVFRCGPWREAKVP